MGLTLVAILMAALLLPWVVAAHAFYAAARTAEVDVAVPSLSTPLGIVQTGLFSVAVHAGFSLGLLFVGRLPDLTGLPLANPYLLLAPDSPALANLDAIAGLFGGLVLLCLVAQLLGVTAGAITMRFGRGDVFYGPLTNVIALARRDDASFIAAEILTKIVEENHVLGYRGTVISLSRENDGFPSKILLSDVSIFYLPIGSTRANVILDGGAIDTIDSLALSAADWHNIGFTVYRVEPPTASAYGSTFSVTS